MTSGSRAKESHYLGEDITNKRKLEKSRSTGCNTVRISNSSNVSAGDGLGAKKNDSSRGGNASGERYEA